MTTPSSEEPLTFEHDDRETHVWLVRDADDYRALHDMIAVEIGGERTIFDVTGWQEERPIQAILALAGFTGSASGGGELTIPPKETPVVPLRGFVVKDPSKIGDVQMMVRLALTGRLGGFHPIVHGQSGFHRAVMAFEYVWNAAGCPPIRIRHPEGVDGETASEFAPMSISEAAEKNVTLAAVRSLEKR
jgi:hypothetical protein